MRPSASACSAFARWAEGPAASKTAIKRNTRPMVAVPWRDRQACRCAERVLRRDPPMARPQKKVVPQPTQPPADETPRDWGDTLPRFLRNVSWLRWLEPLSAEVRLSLALVALAAVLGAVAMLTSPLFVFLARQAVPDPVFVGLLEGAMACLMIVMFESEDAAQHPGWAAAFYCFVGLATLSKGLLGFALPGAVALVYCIATGEWHRLRRLHLAAGSLIVLAICAPWYGTMFAFDGRDEEGKTFFERFIIHDHFKRLAVGVHTTTPGGTFTYFLDQIGFDTFPWVFAFPGAATVMARIRLRPHIPRDRAMLFLLLWLLIGFAVLAFPATT